MTSVEAHLQIDRLVSHYPEIQAQADIFSSDSLHLSEIGLFDPSLGSLADKIGQRVISIDIGGDKIVAADKVVGNDGRLHTVTKLQSGSREHGKDYLAVMETLADKSHSGEGTIVGISFAGPTSGTKPIEGVNVNQLMTELQHNYAGDFIGASLRKDVLFGENLAALTNDAVAGLYAGAAEAVHQYPEVENVIYLINGSGIGGAILKNGKIYAAEPGHVQVEDVLNPYGIQEGCGILGQNFTCIERVAGGKAGIEAAWKAQTGQSLSGREIAEQAHAGNSLALSLYNNAAMVTAAVIEGISRAMDITLMNGKTAIVFHGGVFNVELYKNQIEEILTTDGSRSPILFTADFSENACLDGAALAAIAG